MSSSTTSTAFGVAAYSIEVSSTSGRVGIYLYGEIGLAAAERLTDLLAMVEIVDAPVHLDLSGVSLLAACGVEPLIEFAGTRQATGRAGVFIAASAPARQCLGVMQVNGQPAFDFSGRGDSLVRS